MRRGKHIYHVYIMTNKTDSTLYVGMTGIGYKRTEQHIHNELERCTKKYHLTKLVYFEAYGHVFDAIRRKKQIKRWSRKKKEWLIETRNPDWEDLYEKIIENWKTIY